MLEKLPEFIANHLFMVCLFAALFILLLWDIYGAKVRGVKFLQPAQATRLINSEDAVLFDLRSQDDFHRGHILGAKNVPTTEWDNFTDRFSSYKERVVILYCGNGVDSNKRTRWLMGDGFEKVYCLKGGLQEWERASLPLIRR